MGQRNQIMRKKVHSKAGLFLIELMIAITFFAVTASIFMQVFVKSHKISQEAEDLFHAQSLASSVAEVLEGMDGTEDFSEGLKKYFPELDSDSLIGYYDEDWEETEQDDGAYVLTVNWSQEGFMWDVDIIVAYREGKELYRLDLQIFRPVAAKGGYVG